MFFIDYSDEQVPVQCFCWAFFVLLFLTRIGLPVGCLRALSPPCPDVFLDKLATRTYYVYNGYMENRESTYEIDPITMKGI